MFNRSWWLRLAWVVVIIVVIARRWKLSLSRATLAKCALLGVATAGMTLCFMPAVERIPLGTASAPEFLGPLSIAVIQGRGATRTRRRPPVTDVGRGKGQRKIIGTTA